MSDLSGLQPPSPSVLPLGVSFTPLEDLIPARVTSSPFIGLRPFEVEDAPLFFGRREQIDELLQRLRKTRFVAVVGSSGCGKSSLVRAGLIHALQAGFLVADRDLWDIRTMKPGDRPLRNLAAALLEEEAEPAALDELTAQICRLRYRAVLKRFQPSIEQNENVLLVVDQFEEIFRFDLNGDAEGRDEAEDLIAILLALAQKPDLPIYVGLTMRSDFMGDCDAFPGLAEAMNRSVYLVPRLTREQRRDAIEGPIRMAGAEISPHLTDQLLNESDTAADQLPVLQHALMRTWEEWRKDEDVLGVAPPEGNGRRVRRPVIGTEHYEKAGTLKDALSDHAEKALEGLDQNLTRKIFQALTDVDAFNRQIRRPARLRELTAVTGGSCEAILEILERFQSDGRCFVGWGPKGDPDPFVDLSHESLIRRWKTLEGWVEEEAESAATYRELEESTARHLRGEEGLWDDPELPKALEWQKQHPVNAAWAARVRPSELFRAKSWKRPSFDEVLGFLARSKRARDEEQERRSAQERELLLAEERREKLALLAQERKEKLAKAQELAESRQRWVRWMTAVSVLAVVCAVGAGVLFYQGDKALVSSRLTRQSEELASINPQLSLLLAVEALDREPLALQRARAAENALRSALTEAGGHGLGAHGKAVISLEVAPDGAGLVSGAADGTALLWDLTTEHPESTPAELYALDVSGRYLGNRAPAVHVAAAHGLVAIGSADGSVRMAGGRLLLQPGGEEISALALSRDGRFLAAGDARGRLRAWDLSGRKARSLQVPPGAHRERIAFARVSDDSRWLVTTSTEGRMVLWSLRPGLAPVQKKTEEQVSAVSLNGASLAIGGTQGNVRLWQLASHGPRSLTDLKASEGNPPILAIAVSPDGDRIVTTIPDGSITFRLWKEGKNVPLLRPDDLPEEERSRITELKIDPSGNWLVAASMGGPVWLWLPGKWEAKQGISLRGHSGAVRKVAFSPTAAGAAGSHWLFTGGSDGTVRRWDLTQPDPAHEKAVLHRGAPGAQVAAASPDLRWLVTVTKPENGDLQAQLCRVADSRSCEPLDGWEIRSLRFSSDSRWLMTSSYGPAPQRQLRLRDLNATVKRGVNLQGISAIDLGVDPVDPWLVAGAADSSIRVWHLRPGGGRTLESALPQVKGAGPVERVVITPDRHFILVAREQGGDVELWKRKGAAWQLEYLSTRNREGGPVFGVAKVAISPDEKWLATIDLREVALRVWDLTAAKLAPGPELRISCSPTELMFNRGNRLIVGCQGGEVLSFVPQAQNGRASLEPWRAFAGHRASITSLAANPGGRYLATGAADGSARVWDLTNPELEPAVIPGDGGAIVGSFFEENAKRTKIVTVSRDATVRRWSLNAKDLRSEAREVTGRNLRADEWCRYLRRSRFSAYHLTFGELPKLWRATDSCSAGEAD